MIAEIAHGLTWLAAACAALLIVATWRLPQLIVPAALALGWLWLWILVAWLWLFWTVDLSVAAVAAHSHSRLPEGLRLAAAVLSDGRWLALSALIAFGAAGLALIRPSRRGLGIIGGVALALHGVALVAVQPFARLSPAPTEGAGFDPRWRDGLANFGPRGHPAFDGVLAVGAAAGDVRLAAVTPVAGEDSTGILAEVRIASDDIVLAPEWRETILPRHASSVPASVWAGTGWWRAALGEPRRDGRWRVTLTWIPAWPGVALGFALTGAVAYGVRGRAR